MIFVSTLYIIKQSPSWSVAYSTNMHTMPQSLILVFIFLVSTIIPSFPPSSQVPCKFWVASTKVFKSTCHLAINLLVIKPSSRVTVQMTDQNTRCLRSLGIFIHLSPCRSLPLCCQLHMQLTSLPLPAYSS